MMSNLRRRVASAVVVAVGSAAFMSPAAAQCGDCAAPVVAYQPLTTTVAYQPDAGWYPGKLLDQWRARRQAAASTYTAAYPSTYAAYTAGYAPYVAGYAPYVTGYAPLATSSSYIAGYAPAPYAASYAPAVGPSCSSCAAPQTSYYAPMTYGYPATFYRPALLSPVVGALDNCGATASCDSCGYGSAAVTYDPGVGAASYEGPASGCASCGGNSTWGDSLPASSVPSAAATPGSSIPIPELNEPTPADRYPTQRIPLDDRSRPTDPGPTTDDSTSSGFYEFEAPRLLPPTGDRTASKKPTAPIWQAVYRGPQRSTPAAAAASHDAQSRSQAELDAAGWRPVPADRQAAR